MGKNILYVQHHCPACISMPAGDEYWSTIEHGTRQQVGNFEYYGDGNSAVDIGNLHVYDGRDQHH